MTSLLLGVRFWRFGAVDELSAWASMPSLSAWSLVPSLSEPESS
jgi:hypothetical protein